jgi:hypothetical protein
LGNPGLETAVDRFVVEGAVRAEVATTPSIHRLPEVDGPVWVGGLVGLLGLIPGPGQVAVQHPGHKLVRRQGPDSAATDPVLPAPWVVGGVDNRPRACLPDRFVAGRVWRVAR